MRLSLFTFVFMLSWVPVLSFSDWPVAITNVVRDMPWTNALGQQIYSSLIERAEATLYEIDDDRNGSGNGDVTYEYGVDPWGGVESITYSAWSPVSTARFDGLSQSYTVYAGPSTNPGYSLYDIAVVTNPFQPFVWTSTNSGYVTTNHAYITQGLMAAFDRRIDDLMDYYVQHLVVDGTSETYNAWFDEQPTYTNGLAVECLGDFPRQNRPDLFTAAGIGYVTNRQTNAFGVCTNVPSATAEYLRAPPSTNLWVLSRELVALTNGWTQTAFQRYPFRGDEYHGPFPSLYYSSISNQSVTVTIDGWTEDATHTFETASVLGGGSVLLSNEFEFIWSFSTPAVSLTGDHVYVAYRADFPFYGDFPYKMFAEDYQERQKAIDQLRWVGFSRHQYPYPRYATNTYVRMVKNYRPTTNSNYTWAQAKAVATNEFIYPDGSGINDRAMHAAIGSKWHNADFLTYGFASNQILATARDAQIDYRIDLMDGLAKDVDVYLMVDRRVPAGSGIDLTGGYPQWLYTEWSWHDPGLSSAFDFEPPVTEWGEVSPGRPSLFGRYSSSSGVSRLSTRLPENVGDKAWPDAPAYVVGEGGYHGTISGRGFWIHRESTVFVVTKWDVSGGFRYLTP